MTALPRAIERFTHKAATYWQPQGHTLDALNQAKRDHTVTFDQEQKVILCIDGREIIQLAADEGKFANWTVENIEKNELGEYHFPGGMTGLVLIPMLRVLQEHGITPTPEQIGVLVHNVHQVFDNNNMPFIWHYDAHISAEDAKGAKNSNQVKCAAIQMATEGKVPNFSSENDITAATEAHAAVSDHKEGVGIEYGEKHLERALLINLSPEFTLDGSPLDGNQWFIFDLVACINLLQDLSPQLYTAMRNAGLGENISQENFGQEVTHWAARFGVNAGITLAEKLEKPIYVMPADQSAQPIRLRNPRSLYPHCGLNSASNRLRN